MCGSSTQTSKDQSSWSTLSRLKACARNKRACPNPLHEIFYRISLSFPVERLKQLTILRANGHGCTVLWHGNSCDWRWIVFLVVSSLRVTQPERVGGVGQPEKDDVTGRPLVPLEKPVRLENSPLLAYHFFSNVKKLSQQSESPCATEQRMLYVCISHPMMSDA